VGRFPSGFHILVLTLFRLFLGFLYRCCVLSGKRRSCRQRDTNDGFGNFQIRRVLGLSKVLIGIEFVYVCSKRRVCVLINVRFACVF
jgi:hypothetical protein